MGLLLGGAERDPGLLGGTSVSRAGTHVCNGPCAFRGSNVLVYSNAGVQEVL